MALLGWLNGVFLYLVFPIVRFVPELDWIRARRRTGREEKENGADIEKRNPRLLSPSPRLRSVCLFYSASLELYHRACQIFHFIPVLIVKHCYHKKFFTPQTQ